MRRYLRFAVAGAGLAAVVAAASAMAAGNTKPYTANVRVENAADMNTFRLTITNDPNASQSLGSANFTLPPNFTAPDGTSAITNVSSAGFTVSVLSNVVQFRATSSSTALGKGASVWADVTVTLPGAGLCTSAAWSVQARQSNDFSGTPGNFMTLSSTADLTPLGSFAVAPIETVLPGDIHVPQILVNSTEPLSATAYDTCGHVDADYSGGTVAALVANPARLVGATFVQPSWANGVGAGSLTPTVTEPADNVVVSDPSNGISATSNQFDVVEKICAQTGTTCQWKNKNQTITVTSTVGSSTTGNVASLGLGFRSVNALCNISGSSFGDSIQIIPLNYAGSYSVTITYAKNAHPNGGSASNFNVCKTTDGVNWAPIPQCPNPKVPAPPCAVPSNAPGGALQITLYLNPGDPGVIGFG